MAKVVVLVSVSSQVRPFSNDLFSNTFDFSWEFSYDLSTHNFWGASGGAVGGGPGFDSR